MSSAPVDALVVTDIFPPQVGGSGELLFNVYSRFGAVPVTVLAQGPPGQAGPREEYMRVVRDPARPVRWGVLHPGGLVGHMRRAARVRRLSADRPAVVHCGRALPEGLGVWLAARSGRRRYVCWTHGEELAYASASRELNALLRTAHGHAARLIANSHHTAGLLVARGIERSRIAVVYPGVDSDRFRPDVPGHVALRRQLAGSDDLLLLTIGRLQRRKGHDLVLRSLPALPASVRYVIVGDGQERQALAALARDLGVEERVHFTGAVPSEDLPAYYAAADVFVHPNRVDGEDFEGFGIVFLEAAAAGLPVIAGSSGGVPEAVAGGRTGTLVSGTSVGELRGAIADLAADPHRRRAMGDAGRSRSVNEFTWQRAADQVLEIHTEVARELGK